MTEIFIRPEAIEDAAKAYSKDYGTHLDHTRAAIDAFCEAEGLTVERRGGRYPINDDGSLGDEQFEQRLVGKWHDVKEEQ